MMEINYNMRTVGTCRYNRKGFDSKKLLQDKKCDRGTFKILVKNVAKGFGKVTRSKGGDSITVKYPKESIAYQQHMGGVD